MPSSRQRCFCPLHIPHQRRAIRLHDVVPDLAAAGAHHSEGAALSMCIQSEVSFHWRPPAWGSVVRSTRRSQKHAEGATSTRDGDGLRCRRTIRHRTGGFGSSTSLSHDAYPPGRLCQFCRLVAGRERGHQCVHTRRAHLQRLCPRSVHSTAAAATMGRSNHSVPIFSTRLQPKQVPGHGDGLHIFSAMCLPTAKIGV